MTGKLSNVNYLAFGLKKGSNMYQNHIILVSTFIVIYSFEYILQRSKCLFSLMHKVKLLPYL